MGENELFTYNLDLQNLCHQATTTTTTKTVIAIQDILLSIKSKNIFKKWVNELMIIRYTNTGVSSKRKRHNSHNDENICKRKYGKAK